LQISGQTLSKYYKVKPSPVLPSRYESFLSGGLDKPITPVVAWVEIAAWEFSEILYRFGAES